MPEKILVLDEQQQIHSFVTAILVQEGLSAITATKMAEVRKIFKGQKPDLVIADVGMPVADLLAMMSEGESESVEVDLIVLASQSDQAAAMEWLAKGAYDFMLKPLSEPRLFSAVVRRALQKRRLAIRNCNLVKELEQSVTRDPLTGLYNHRVLYKCLLDEIVRSSRYNHHFLAMLVDIDGLGAICELHGRDYGDFVMARTARQLEGNLRLTDTVFRYEDGKFLVLLPETWKSQAVCIAERLNEAVRYHDFSQGAFRAHVTVSIGAAEFPMEARDVTSLLWLADLRLTGAKNAGRDGFCFKTYETLPTGI